MALSSDRLSLLAKAILLIHLLVLSSHAYAKAPTTKFIDAVCQRVTNKPYCLKTLTSYPPAVKATGLIPLAEIVINLGISHAEKTISFINKTVKKEGALKRVFDECATAYKGIAMSFRIALSELTTSPDSANYDIWVSHDQTSEVMELVGKNGDLASKTLLKMTARMESFIDLGRGATDAVDDGQKNIHP